MTYKHDMVDDYPYIAYTSKPEAVAPETELEERLDLIEADGWVTEDRIADDAVTTDKIADGAVTPDKLSE